MKREILIAAGLILSATTFAQTSSAGHENGTSVKISAKSSTEADIKEQHMSSSAMSTAETSSSAKIKSDKQNNGPTVVDGFKESEQANKNLTADVRSNSKMAYDDNTAQLNSAVAAKKEILVSSKAKAASDAASIGQQTETATRSLVKQTVNGKAALEKVQSGAKSHVGSNLKIHQTNISSTLRSSAKLGLGLN